MRWTLGYVVDADMCWPPKITGRSTMLSRQIKLYGIDRVHMSGWATDPPLSTELALVRRVEVPFCGTSRSAPAITLQIEDIMPCGYSSYGMPDQTGYRDVPSTPAVPRGSDLLHAARWPPVQRADSGIGQTFSSRTTGLTIPVGVNWRKADGGNSRPKEGPYRRMVRNRSRS